MSDVDHSLYVRNLGSPRRTGGLITTKMRMEMSKIFQDHGRTLSPAYVLPMVGTLEEIEMERYARIRHSWVSVPIYWMTIAKQEVCIVSGLVKKCAGGSMADVQIVYVYLMENELGVCPELHSIVQEYRADSECRVETLYDYVSSLREFRTEVDMALLWAYHSANDLIPSVNDHVHHGCNHDDEDE